MIQSRLPGAIATELLAGLKAKAAVQVAASWVEAKAPRFLVLEGHPGCGKSLAAAWAWEFVYDRIRNRGPVLGPIAAHDPWPVWCDTRLVAAMVGHEWRHEEQWASFDRARLVVIDDVGLEREPDRMSDLLERLYNVSSGRAILTTNLSFETFSARYGERVQSRIIGSARWAQCADPDMRMQRPEGESFPPPQRETAGELVARLKAEEDRKREEAEWEAGEADRERWWTEQMKLITNLGDEKTWRYTSNNASDEERRELLRKQVEQLKTDREGA
jgi:hypothetical protein